MILSYVSTTCVAVSGFDHRCSTDINALVLKPTVGNPLPAIVRNMPTAAPNHPPSPLAYRTSGVEGGTGVSGVARWSVSVSSCTRTCPANSRVAAGRETFGDSRTLHPPLDTATSSTTSATLRLRSPRFRHRDAASTD